jgi:hypothetical protein
MRDLSSREDIVSPIDSSAMGPHVRHPELQLLYLRRDLAEAFGEEVLTAARVGGLLARGRTQEEIAEELRLGSGKMQAALRLLRNAATGAA